MRRLLAVPLVLLLLGGAAPAGAVVDPAATACPPSLVPGGVFDDVLPQSATGLAVDCLHGHGILSGTSDAVFSPGRAISRGQVALVLDRLVGYAYQATGTAQPRPTAGDYEDAAEMSAATLAAVGRLTAEGVLGGRDDDGDGRPSFLPRDLISRAQSTAALLRAHDAVLQVLGSPHDRTTDDPTPFDDVEGIELEAQIEALWKEGVVAGTGARTFSPSQPVTRAQLALLTARLLEDLAAKGDVPSRYAPGGAPLATTPIATTGALTTVARGLSTPWGLAPLPGGGALVSERDTALVKRVGADGTVTTLGRVPGVAAGGEGGLLGLALSPRYVSDGLVYAYLTSASDNRVVRFVLAPGPTGVVPVLTGIPKGSVHNGGRLRFGPDGMLYVGTGDAGVTDRAQDRASLGGKVLRVAPDGTAPGDNPFGGPVLSIGHRNVQGLAFDAAGRLWISELGQNTWDEVNVVRRGRNYGWPAIEGVGRRDDYVDPRVVWSPAEASPSGVTVAGGSLWVASLRGERLWQVPLDGSVSGTPRAHLVGAAGRLRAVEQVADGSLWVLTNESDARVLRLEIG